jgi:Protein of unknown function (DUF2490)
MTAKTQTNNTIIWNSLQLPLQLPGKWQLANDVSYRTLGFSAAAFQYTFRTAIRYQVDKQWNLSFGIANFNTRSSFSNANREFIHEYRLHQEVLFEHLPAPKFAWQHRFRSEERFFAATPTQAALQALRVRYRLLAIQTINEHWKLLAGNEYMHQLANKKFEFQQNRAQAAVQYIINNSSQVQGGYIWSKLSNANQHFITLTFQKKITWHGNKTRSGDEK